MYKAHTFPLGQAERAFDLSNKACLPLPQGIATIPEILKYRAAIAPEQAAFYVIGAQSAVTEISNAALLQEATLLAQRLSAHGVKAGDIVLLAFETSPCLVTAFFACQVGGFLPCIVEAPSPGIHGANWAERLAVRAQYAGARLILAPRDCCDLLREAGCRATTVEDLPMPHEARFPAPTRDASAFLQFTSGTTSQPKALLIDNKTLLSNVRGLALAAGWSHQDTVVSWLPLYHDMGLVALTMCGFAAGMSVVLMPSTMFTMNPARWLWAIHSFKGTVTSAPNFAYQFVATHAPEHRTRGLDLSSLRCAFNAAEFIQKKTVEHFFNRFAPHGLKREALFAAYGLAECTVAVTFSRPSESVRFQTISRQQFMTQGVANPVDAAASDAWPVASVGPVLKGHEVMIVDNDGSPLPERRQGQIYLRGPSVVHGYYKETAPSNIHNGWLATGDLGYLDNGELYITGRIKDLIIRAGANISPYEIEQVVGEIEGVRSGAVGAIGLSDPVKGTENLVVFFETTQKASEKVEAMRHAIRDRLSQKLSIAVDHVLNLPPHTLQKTTSGKLQRVKLVQLAQEKLSASMH
ncbi:AMP-binding protein [Microvirga guangxiensis]|uniref:Acyl-CoA synthetase (AMP-forming)/AMP-acid ligase II n=1 Tax=Microvirga guangxiensis TaxID=549386 RepID=A0A1G5IX81_9HYPH|nr:AMP-binding protein [Microvirga guangxiensis]SCY80494.1 Acyl-CoA synthetase (AMP-forming)/AMP-acid ligase II [Microvirga guangxiensis]